MTDGFDPLKHNTFVTHETHSGHFRVNHPRK